MNCPQLPPFTSFSTRFPQIHHYQLSLSIIICKIKLDLKLGPLRWLHWWPQKLLWVCYQVVAEYLPPIADFANLASKVWRWQLQVDRGAAELKAGACLQETLCRWQFSPMAFILFIFSWPQKSQLYCNLIIRTAFATISMFVNLMVILFIFVVGAMTERGSNKKPEHEVSSNKTKMQRLLFKFWSVSHNCPCKVWPVYKRCLEAKDLPKNLTVVSMFKVNLLMWWLIDTHPLTICLCTKL